MNLLRKEDKGTKDISRKKQSKETRETLRRELEDYNRQGIALILNGSSCNPKKIAKAYTIEEEGVYMRDYVANEKGEICQVRFDLIKKEKE